MPKGRTDINCSNTVMRLTWRTPCGRQYEGPLDRVNAMMTAHRRVCKACATAKLVEEAPQYFNKISQEAGASARSVARANLPTAPSQVVPQLTMPTPKSRPAPYTAQPCPATVVPDLSPSRS
jgi:hypothetical protein